MKQQLSELVKPLQEIIDQELAVMPAKEVNKILHTMTADEANNFLGRLGQIRAAQIYKEGYNGFNDSCDR